MQAFRTEPEFSSVLPAFCPVLPEFRLRKNYSARFRRLFRSFHRRISAPGVQWQQVRFECRLSVLLSLPAFCVPAQILPDFASGCSVRLRGSGAEFPHSALRRKSPVPWMLPSPSTGLKFPCIRLSFLQARHFRFYRRESARLSFRFERLYQEF